MEYRLFDSQIVRVFYIFLMLIIGFYFIRKKESTGTYMDYEQI